MLWQRFYEAIKNKKSFLISAHLGLEGDAVGSSVALSAFLRSLGKQTILLNDDPIPDNLLFLTANDTVLQSTDSLVHDAIAAAEACFVVDVSNWNHMGKTGKLIESSGKPIYCIDHHQCSEPIGDIAHIDPSACSAGILIYDLIRSYDSASVSKEIAQAVYTAIITDTGNFRFSNTNAAAFTICADLMNQGINHSAICNEVYENNPVSRFRLMHETLGTLKLSDDGRIVWVIITQDMLAKTHSTIKEAEGFVDMLRTIKGVELSILFRQLSPDTTKATFRSKEYIDVQQLASHFNGGGHKRAAGATIHAPVDKAVEQVLSTAKTMAR
ncbi:MAG: bifunctional oligoribonuclease/PAP phosphatase NrnA [Candidatus Auribacter fodinae]|jgi:phosphoesterase RecJ-like protein|uniref:Bifunctional oligoribonuclease/PAP phosphatase NrnA n=1 Tax=Candidatus Auribacter fodinae TaxID=2093366 RepID=A0A3A4R977_9BACT|nr:MAG: bifunctional oligoribonuclease/PAP phosphatase NrnA [Candidatus Auribacter fodinae]